MKNFLKLLLAIIILLLIVELVSYSVLKIKDKQESFFLKLNKTPKLWNGEHKDYSLLDPLLGWGINEDSIASRNFVAKYASIYLESNIKDNSNPIVIYISGGSTSDLMFDGLNWPYYLQNFFKENNIAANIYVGAVGGYNTGQELLKVLKDINEINPDYHISYSGANEVDNGSYVTLYEYDLYLSMSKKYYGLLPNFKKLILNNASNVSVSERIVSDNFHFWANNMSAMQALAVQNNYKFIGILQPVINYGSLIKNDNFDKLILNNYIEGYDKFYPKAILHADSVDYIYNYTDVFKYYSSELIFKDDCHLGDRIYQEVIAKNIFELIEKCF